MSAIMVCLDVNGCEFDVAVEFDYSPADICGDGSEENCQIEVTGIMHNKVDLSILLANDEFKEVVYQLVQEEINN